MTMPQPKLLTAITVPTGGWAIKVYLSTLAAGQFGVNFTATIAAGTYYIAWDGQSDDLLRALGAAMQTAMVALGAPFNADSYIIITLTDTHHVRFHFYGSEFADNDQRDVRIAWPESSTSLAAALGFDSSANDDATGVDNPSVTGDWQHAYGWYADDDGLYESDWSADIAAVQAEQAKSLGGIVKTLRYSETFRNELKLHFVPGEKTFSDGVGYGQASVTPYERNAPLECWWREASQGVRFRYYRDGRGTLASAADAGTATAGAATTLTNANKSLDIDPQIHKSRILFVEAFGASSVSVDSLRYFIVSHTATIYTVYAHPSGLNTNSVRSTYFVFDQPYKTYVLDVEAMREFAHENNPPTLDAWGITIPMLRYET